MRKIIFCLVAFIHTSASAQNAFKSLEIEFDEAAAPNEKAALGYWGGNCATASEPDAFWPAVLVVKEMQTSNGGLGTSLSYFWERDPAKDHFRNMSVAEVESHKDLSDWLAKEQWTVATEKNDSLTNEYKTRSSHTLFRELRHSDDGFRDRYLLRVIRKHGIMECVTLVCEFDKHLGAYRQRGAGVTYFGQSGALADQRVSVRNANVTTDIERIELTHRGQSPITLSQLSVVDDNGAVYPSSMTITLEPNVPYALKRSANGPKRVRRLDFYINGSTDGIDIQTYSTP
jgi:hypothetical protein